MAGGSEVLSSEEVEVIVVALGLLGLRVPSELQEVRVCGGAGGGQGEGEGGLLSEVEVIVVALGLLGLRVPSELQEVRV